MSNHALAPVASTQQKTSILAKLGGKYSVEPKQLLTTLKDTAFKGASDAQMVALCVVADQYGLNPFTREIYAFPDRKSGGIVPVIGVDGWYSMVNSHPEFDGVEFEEVDDADGNLVKTICRIYRKDRSRPVEISEHLSECRRNTDPWNGQPRRMLRHRAFIQAARVAFSIAASDPEDGDRIKDVEAKVIERPKLFDAPAPPNGAQGEPGDGGEGSAHETKAAPGASATVDVESGEADFSLEGEAEFPANAEPIDQVNFLLERADMSEAELFGILHASKFVGDEVNSVGMIGDRTLTKIVQSWDLIIAEREGGAA